MTERESGTASTVTAGEAKGISSRASKEPTPSPRSYRTLWVIVLTLPVTIVGLAIAFEIFGLLLRLSLH
jgi:Mn2+/Fe2+ NRAMP family transporter